MTDPMGGVIIPASMNNTLSSFNPMHESEKRAGFAIIDCSD